MIDIRVSEFAKNSYTRQRLLYTDDILRVTSELSNKWKKEKNDEDNSYYSSMKFHHFEIAQDDRTLYTLTFESESKCSKLVDAANQCRKALLRGVSKAGFICKESQPLSFDGVDTEEPTKVNAAFVEWAKSLEFRKRTIGSWFTNFRLLWLPLLLLALLLLAALLLWWLNRDKVRGGKSSVHVKESISSKELATKWKNSVYKVKYDALDDFASVKKNKSEVIPVLSNDRHLEGKEFVELTFTTPSKGSVVFEDDETVPGGKSLRYIPEDNYIGEDSFTYSVKVKNRIGVEEDSATVNILVSEEGENSLQPLVAIDDSVFFPQSESNKTYSIDVLKNDICPNSGVEITVNSKPKYGEVGVTSKNQIYYTLKAGSIGEDSFEYSLKFDDRVSRAKVYITINHNDDAIYANNDFVKIDKGETAKIDVLDNDVYQGEKPSITIAKEQKPKHGTVVITKDNVVVYTPEPDYSGNDSFGYSIAESPYGTAFVSITIADSSADSLYGIAHNNEYYVTAGTSNYLYPLDNDELSPSNKHGLKIYGVGKPLHGDIDTDGNRIIYKSGVTSTGEYYIGRDVFPYYIAPKNENGEWPVGVEEGYIIVNIRSNDDNNEEDVQDQPPELPQNNHALFLKPGETGTLTLDKSAEPSIINNESYALLGKVFAIDNVITYQSNGETGKDSFVFVNKTDGVRGKVDVYISDSDARPEPDRFSTPRNQGTLLNVLVNDLPKDDSAVIDSCTRPVNGKIEIQEDRKAIYYEPNPEFVGWDTFTYRSSSLPDQDVKVQVYVYDKTSHGRPELPSAKIAYDDLVYTDVNQPVAIRVLDNDYPVDNAIQIESYTQPLHGSAVRKNDYIIYTPDQDFEGRDFFIYDIDDVKTDTQGKGMVSIVVGNEPGGRNIAHNDDVSTFKNQPITISVFNNDQRIGGDPLNISVKPTYGIAEVDGDSIRYTPNKDFIGRDYFNYYIGSDEDDASSALVCVHVLDDEPGTVVYGPSAEAKPVVSGKRVVTYPPKTRVDKRPDGFYIIDPDGTETRVYGGPSSIKGSGGDIVIEDGGETHVVHGGSITYEPGTRVSRYSDDELLITEQDGTKTIVPGGRVSRTRNGRRVVGSDGIEYIIPDKAPEFIEPDGPVTTHVVDPYKSLEDATSDLILVLDDTRDVYESLPKLKNAISNHLKKNKNAKLSCIVFDDSHSPKRIFTEQVIDKSNLNDIMDEIKDSLHGLEKWNDDGKVENYVKSLTEAEKLTRSNPKDSTTFLITDGDSSTIYNQAHADNNNLLPDEVTKMKKKMINLPSRMNK